MGSELCEGCPLHAPHEKPFRPPLLNIKHLSAAQSQSQEPGTGRGRVSSTGTHLTSRAHTLSGQQELPKGHGRADEDSMEPHFQMAAKQKEEEGDRQQYLWSPGKNEGQGALSQG